MISYKTTLLPTLLPKVGFFLSCLQRALVYTLGLSSCGVVLETQLEPPFSCVPGKQGSFSPFQEPLPSSPRLLCPLRGPACHPICLALRSLAAGWTRMVDFQPPRCLAPWRTGGSMRCNPITSSPRGKERRQEASQKTENKRLSNCLQQNREFHEGMLNLVAP